ncbi:MAG: ABC transporter ATP-binding protein [Gammaproteobacteria bacterium]|nr:ABC transporter ATP-binding protein [Gammaproteobacteria bacterium]
MDAFVEVQGLRIVTDASAPGGSTTLVHDVSFAIPRGEVLALIGESGSGKTTIALALLGHARRGCRIEGGQVRVGDLDLRALSSRELEAVRGMRIAYVAQSAAAAFNPAHTLMDQVIESARLRGIAPRAELERRAVALFQSLSLPDPQNIGGRYPHQVSGGQLQRIMAAMALVADPDLVIFDEPTTALDVTTQIEVLRAIRHVLREHGTTAVYVSHDLALVAQLADRVVVLQGGRVRESGTAVEVLAAPRDAYTQTLVAAHQPVGRSSAGAAQAPGCTGGAAAPQPVTAPLLRLCGVTAGYGPRDRDGLPRATVLRDLDLEIGRGATLGVIGESGSGKSTLARVIAGLVPAARGTLELDGARLAPALEQRHREDFRRIQLVFQDADTSLNPAHSVERLLSRPLELYHGQRGAAARAEVARLLDLVKLPAAVATRLPRELSGGQKQRVSLARALAAGPDLLLCDEVTASLDTVVGAAILELLASLRRELGLAMIFISHDIANTREICDSLLVLYGGRRVQGGDREGLRAPPFHPYTDLLVASVPRMRRGWLDEVAQRPALLAAQAASGPRAAPGLCPFLPRCAARVAGVCDREPAPLRRDDSGREVVCHLELDQLAAWQAAEIRRVEAG